MASSTIIMFVLPDVAKIAEIVIKTIKLELSGASFKLPGVSFKLPGLHCGSLGFI